METMQYDDFLSYDDVELNTGLRSSDEGRQQKRHDIRRGIEDYLERKELNRLDNWFDFD